MQAVSSSRPITTNGNNADGVDGVRRQGVGVCDGAMLMGRSSGAVTTSGYSAEHRARVPARTLQDRRRLQHHKQSGYRSS
jgi:hypothetical protein